MKRSAAEITRECGPFPGVENVHGATHDGQRVWFAAGDKLNAFDPTRGKVLRSIDVAAHAGTAFDGQHLFQIAEDRIQKIDPKSGPLWPQPGFPRVSEPAGAPDEWLAGAARLPTMARTRDYPAPAWRQLMIDAERFLDLWDPQAASLGWQDWELFAAVLREVSR